MTDAELTRTYQDVAAAVNARPVSTSSRSANTTYLYRHDAHTASARRPGKPSVWAKIGKDRAGRSTASSPAPSASRPRNRQHVISAAEGIKNKNWVQAVIGGASGVAAGATAIAGRAVGRGPRPRPRASLTAYAKGARAWQAGLQRCGPRRGGGVRAVAGAGARGGGSSGFGRDGRQVGQGRGDLGRARLRGGRARKSAADWPDQLLAVGRHGANLI